MVESNERDRDIEAWEERQEKAIRALFDFLNRHPDRREHFIRDTVAAGAPREVVERLLTDWDSFLVTVRGDVEGDVADEMDLVATAEAAERVDSLAAETDPNNNESS